MSQGMPEHYVDGDFETIDFIEYVLANVSSALDCGYGGLRPRSAYCIKDALKYALRAGKKGPWQEDAYKCADYLVRMMTGSFIGQIMERVSDKCDIVEDSPECDCENDDEAVDAE